METASRCCGQVRPRTAGRNEPVRLLLLFFPMLFHNAWTLARHPFRRIGGSVTMTTLRIFSRYPDVLTRESVRRTGPPDPRWGALLPWGAGYRAIPSTFHARGAPVAVMSSSLPRCRPARRLPFRTVPSCSMSWRW